MRHASVQEEGCMAESAEQLNAEQAYYLLEHEQVFARSQIWEMQRHYFESMGVEAWRRGEVPHYVTNNPRTANSFAETVFAFYQDQERLAPADEPLTICELGAGSGRFAFHFLRRLRLLCDDAHVPLTAFRYVLTDLAPSNVAFWREHPRFQSFIEAGVLDCAVFDLNQTAELAMQVSGEAIHAGTLHRPLVVIANYLFDTVPQDLFYIHDQQCEECLVSLFVSKEIRTPTVADLLANLEYQLDRRALTDPPYHESALQRLLTDYQRTLVDSYLLFPAIGLRCVNRLRALSRRGVMVLSADKGDHTLAALQHRPPPSLVRHGSFSLTVNYHAFKALCEYDGGIALFPSTHHRSLNICCLLMVPDPERHDRTLSAYRRFVEEFGPDDFYSMTKHANKDIATMSVEDILAFVRLSYYDGHQFARYVSRLVELVPEFSPNDREVVIAAVERAWEMHFPLGEDVDFADLIARLLYDMNEYARAITFFERSNAIYGPHTGTLNNIAVCYQQLGQPEEAEHVLEALRAAIVAEPSDGTAT
ncbi:MAG: tetratricopeptide repeat protein [Thermomicrobiales bacterium]